MAVTHSPIFVQVPKLGALVVTAANTAKDGSGTIGTICTASSDGGKLKRIRACNAPASPTTNSAGLARIFYSVDGGTTWHFLQEKALAATASSATVAGAEAIFTFPDGLDLQPSALIGGTETIYAGVQDRLVFTGEYGNNS